MDANQPPSPFVYAIRHHVAQMQRSNKKVPAFIERCGNNCESDFIDAIKADINGRLMAGMKLKSANQTLIQVFNAIKDYEAVLSTLVSADPMPSALIWGGMLAIVNLFGRYASTFDKIDSQLKRLAHEVTRLRQYDEVFKDSEIMREELTTIYKHIISFWVAIDEYCSKSSLTLAFKALTSATTKKLNDLVESIAYSREMMNLAIPIVQERIRKQETENTSRERQKVVSQLDDIMRISRGNQREQSQEKIRRFLDTNTNTNTNGQDPLQTNDNRQTKDGEKVLEQYGGGNGLVSHPDFQTWVARDSGKNVLWLHGDPGTGKSVLCARAVKDVQTRSYTHPPAVGYYYWNFGTNFSSVEAYKILALQLFQDVRRNDDASDLVDLLYLSRKPEEVLKTLIEVLVIESRQTYVFLDGIDEFFSELPASAWDSARDILAFFLALANKAGTELKVWCSSQTLPQIRSIFNGESRPGSSEPFDLLDITVDKSTNSADIAAYFKIALASDFDGATEANMGINAALIDMMKRKVEGNFVYARMVLDSVRWAESPREALDEIQEGGRGFEDYFQKLIRRLADNSPNKRFLATVLSFLTYAKRPLTHDELCEAFEISRKPAGTNLGDKMDQLQSRNIEQICSPIVRVHTESQSTRTGKVGPRVYTLWHASVKKLLQKNKTVLGEEGSGFEITGKLLARSCIKYLKQPRYKRLLKTVKAKSGAVESVTTYEGENILGHHLLIYAASSWDSHIWDVNDENDSGLVVMVENFMRSEQFHTCIQIQSMFLHRQYLLGPTCSRPIDLSRSDGSDRTMDKLTPAYVVHFAVYAYDQIASRRQIMQLPEWFERTSPGGKELLQQYHRAITEWAPLLNQHTTIRGGTPGELGRGIWGMLGESNFLSTIPSKFKSFLFEKQTRHLNSPGLVLHDQFCPQTNELFIFRISVSDAYDNIFCIYCETWLLDKWKATSKPSIQTLNISAETVHPTAASANSPLIRLSADSQILRIGSSLFFRAEDQSFYEDRPSEDDLVNTTGYIEEVAGARDLVVLASRRRGGFQFPNEEAIDGSKTDEEDDTNDEADEGDEAASQASYHVAPASELGMSDSDETTSTFASDSDKLSELEDTGGLCGFQNDWDSVKDACSVKSYMSETSSLYQSDELDEEFLNNDFPDSLKDYESDFEPVPSASNQSGDHSDSDESLDRRSNTSSSSKTSSSSDRSAKSAKAIAGSERRKEFEKLLGLQQPTKEEDRISDVWIFRRMPDAPHPQRILHFSQRSKGALNDSPPVVHPTEDLVIWPTAAGTVVFLDVNQKTHFEMAICSPWPDPSRNRVECRLFKVEAQFAASGRYLHLASSYGTVCDAVNHPVHYRSFLFVSTYRLSSRKPTNTYPRLVYQTQFYVNKGFAPPVVNNKGTGFALLHTLTWAEEYLFMVTRDTEAMCAKVFRIPLFREVEARGPNCKESRSIGENIGFADLILPKSGDGRQLFYLPSSPMRVTNGQVPGKGSRKKRKDDAGAALISSVKLETTDIIRKLRSRVEKPSLSCWEQPPCLVQLTGNKFREWQSQDTARGARNESPDQLTQACSQELLAKSVHLHHCDSCYRVLSEEDMELNELRDAHLARIEAQLLFASGSAVGSQFSGNGA